MSHVADSSRGPADRYMNNRVYNLNRPEPYLVDVEIVYLSQLSPVREVVYKMRFSDAEVLAVTLTRYKGKHYEKCRHDEFDYFVHIGMVFL